MTIDGFGPLPVARPAAVADLCDIVRSAAADGSALYPVGGGTMLGYGLPPTKPGMAVDMRGLDRVIDYPARDMTVTVQAGLTVGKLAELLQAERQHLPVDVPLHDRATIGGALATNASGPRRFGYGTLRDYVIGISLVNDLAQEVKGGGRVVKNVAGYDLMKLYTGSLGTLGIISQVTFKVPPAPESSRWLVVGTAAANVPAVLAALQSTKTRPRAITVRGRTGDDCSVVVGFEDNAKAVEWQAVQFVEELPDRLRGGVHDLSATDAVALRDFPLSGDASLTFKANLLPAQTWAFCQQAMAAADVSLNAHAGNGIVVGHVHGDLTAERVASMLQGLIAFAAMAHGNVVVTRCPPAWKSVVPVWGRPTGDRDLMKAVKDKLDPKRVFNPGRFVNGI